MKHIMFLTLSFFVSYSLMAAPCKGRPLYQEDPITQTYGCKQRSANGPLAFYGETDLCVIKATASLGRKDSYWAGLLTQNGRYMENLFAYPERSDSEGRVIDSAQDLTIVYTPTSAIIVSSHKKRLTFKLNKLTGVGHLLYERKEKGMFTSWEKALEVNYECRD